MQFLILAANGLSRPNSTSKFFAFFLSIPEFWSPSDNLERPPFMQVKKLLYALRAITVKTAKFIKCVLLGHLRLVRRSLDLTIELGPFILYFSYHETQPDGCEALLSDCLSHFC